MSVIAELVRLQEIDLALDEQRTASRQIDLRLTDNSFLYEAQSAVRESEALLRELDERQDALERRAEETRGKLQTEESRLYSGAVTNSKELVALQREVTELQRSFREREDALLVQMSRAEEAASRHAAALKNLRQARTERGAEVAVLEERRTALDRAIAELEAKRRDIVTRLMPETVESYERIRGRRQGHAIAKLERTSCSGCRIHLPNDIVSRVQSGFTLVQCPTCERYLAGG